MELFKRDERRLWMRRVARASTAAASVQVAAGGAGISDLARITERDRASNRAKTGRVHLRMIIRLGQLEKTVGIENHSVDETFGFFEVT